MDRSFLSFIKQQIQTYLLRNKLENCVVVTYKLSALEKTCIWITLYRPLSIYITIKLEAVDWRNCSNKLERKILYQKCDKNDLTYR